jgi:hypothetical protein
MSPSVEVQMQINFGGLDIFVPQMVLDVGDGMATVVHVNGPAVAKAMDGIDVFKPLWRKGFFEILFADTVNAMTGEFLSPLIDKEPVLIWGLRRDTIFSDIELEEMRGLTLKLYKPEPVSFSQDSQGPFLRVKVVQI